jgi:prevent-host-death family protein
MMDVIPELVPISGLRTRQNEILDQLADRPVVLTQHGRAAAVLVSPEQWNLLVEMVEDLTDALDALEMRARIASGEETVRDWADIEEELDALSA